MSDETKPNNQRTPTTSDRARLIRRRMVILGVLALVVLAISFGPTVWFDGEPVGSAQAQSPGQRPHILRPELLKSESYGESFTAVADLSDGTYVLAQYVFTNAGFGDGKGACRALVVRPGKDGVNDAVRVGRDQWNYSESGHTLTVDACTLSTAEGRTRFFAKTKKVTVDLTLKAEPSSVQPPGHRIKVDDEFYDAEILIPWADATAKVTTKSGTVELSGTGYLDHTRSNTRLPKVALRWLRFRGFTGTQPLLAEVRYAPSGQVTGWVWKKGDSGPKSIDLSALNFQHGEGWASFVLPSGGVSTSKELYAYRPAEQWGTLGALAKPLVGNPVTRTFTASQNRTDGTLKGVLEYVEINP